MTIREKTMLGYPLDTSEAISLAELPLLELGRLAHPVRERLHARLVYLGESRVEEFSSRLSVRECIERLIEIRGAGYRSVAPVVTAEPGQTTGEQEIRLIALARLILDTVPHIAADWTRLSSATAQISLRFGADTLCGLPGDLPLKEIERHVQEAGLQLAETPPARAPLDPLRVLA